MNKLESTIPFDGFYNSFISSDIEHQIGQQIEWDSDIYDLNENQQQVLIHHIFIIKLLKIIQIFI